MLASLDSMGKPEGEALHSDIINRAFKVSYLPNASHGQAWAIAEITEGPIVKKPSANPQPVDAAITPRFSAIPTFMRLPYLTEPTKVDIALIGVPWDGGTTNRAGARHGPREIRNMSSFMRKVHHVSRIAPYELARIADLGDAPVEPDRPHGYARPRRALLSPRCTRPGRCRSRPAATI